MFPRLRPQETFVAEAKFASSANGSSFARRENISGINVSATMFRRWRAPLRSLLEPQRLWVYFTHCFWKHIKTNQWKWPWFLLTKHIYNLALGGFFFTFSTSIFTQILVQFGVCIVIFQSCVLDECHITFTSIHTLESTAITRVGPVCGTAFVWTETAEVHRGLGIRVIDIWVFTSKTKEWKKYESATGWTNI